MAAKKPGTKRRGRRVDKTALLAEVLLAFRTTPIIEAYIQDDEAHIAGCTDGVSVYVNPVPEACEVVMHELLHVLRPTWSERTVGRWAQRLFAMLGDDEARAFYRAYQRRKKAGRPVQLCHHVH